MTQMAKNPPEMSETWVQSLGWEDLPEKGTATHSGTLAHLTQQIGFPKEAPETQSVHILWLLYPLTPHI